MVHSLQFWKTWHTPYRTLWYVLCTLLVLGMALLWYAYYRGHEGAIQWEKLQEKKTMESTAHTFSLGGIVINVPAENHIILEYFNGAPIHLNEVSHLFFLAALVFSVLVLLTIITALPRFWFILGMGLFVLFMMVMRLDTPGFMGQENNIPAAIILFLYLGVALYFHFFKPELDFVRRAIVFLLLTLVLGVLMAFTASVPQPFLHLATTAYTPAMVISVVFIFTVSHEIPSSLLTLVSQGGNKNLRHYALFSSLYLLYVTLTCFHEMGLLHWNILYIDLYLLLTLSTVLGIWGFYNREPLYASIMPFAPLGAYFIVALGTICMVTVGNLISNQQDAALKIIRDAIIFGHVGYGLIFLTYVFSNFILMLGKNMPVYKVVYKPTRMPYFTFRFAGTIAVLAFVFYSNWREYLYNGLTGFYNGMGDLYAHVGDATRSTTYYEQGRYYGFQNHHSNYALGSIKAGLFDIPGARNNFEMANAKRPSMFSLINEGNLLIWENKYFESIKQFQKAEKAMPGQAVILNNIAFAYGKTHLLDSSFYFLDRARTSSQVRATAAMNFFGFSALEYIPVKVDSLLDIFGTENIGALSNALALANVQQQKVGREIKPLTGKSLDLFSASLMNNYLIREGKGLDSALLNNIARVVMDSLNSDYAEDLKPTLALTFYRRADVGRAMEIMSGSLYENGSRRGKDRYQMGLWLLEQGDPESALDYFDQAFQDGFKKAALYQGIALTEAGRVEEARVAWDSLTNSKDEEEKALAVAIQRTLSHSQSVILSLPDEEKYPVWRYRFPMGDSVSFDRLVQSYQDDNYRVKTLLEQARHQLEWGNIASASRYLKRINQYEITDPGLFEEVVYTELLLQCELGGTAQLAAKMKEGVFFGKEQVLEKAWAEALASEGRGDSVRTVQCYEYIGSANPFFEGGVIAAATYFRKNAKDEMKAYNVLVNALHVNPFSPRLLLAYAAEADRHGFLEFTQSALSRLEKEKRKNTVRK